MNKQQMQQILDKIKEYGKIVIFRHKRPDGDAVGSTKGLAEILRLTYPEKEIYIINNDYSDYTGFLGGEDEARPDEFFADALGIVIDTATIDRISNPQCQLCRELVKIDHHIDRTPYGDLSWVEEEKSSACEMIADFYAAFSDELKINTAAATYIYAGMVTDSGRFRFRSVTGDTLRAAALLLDQNIDTDTLFANLYMKEFHTLKFQAHVYKKMKISPAGVVYLYIDRTMQKKFKLTSEEASASISYLDSIKNSLIWLVCIENEDGSARVRLRSRFVTINEVAERYHGGGHACACGATVQNKKEFKALVDDADALLRDYKANNEGWL